MNQDDNEELERQKAEAERKRKEIKSKYEQMLKASENIKVKRGSMRFLAAILRIHMVFMIIAKDARKTRLKKRAERLKFYGNFLRIYTQVARAWIRKSIKKPLLTIFADTEQILSLNKDSLGLFDPQAELQKRIMLLRVRVKGVLKDLENNTNVDVMPVPLIIFLSNLCAAKSYVPDGFLTTYQLNRIDVDNYGAIISLDENQTKMIVGIFIFARIMILKVLTATKIDGDAQAGIGEVVQDNFLTISSICYWLFMQEINEIMRNYPRVQDKKGDDVFGNKLVPIADLIMFFKSPDIQQKKFVREMR